MTGEIDVTSMLHLDSAAHQSTDSLSRSLSALFAGCWRERHPGAGYRYLDLTTHPVRPIGSGFCSLGRRLEQLAPVPLDAVGDVIRDASERWEWEQTRPLVDELRAADVLLIGAPMYNYGIPAALKAWIDRVTFPGALNDPATGQGLLQSTTVVVIASRGGTYGPGTPRDGWDFQEPYLRTYFRGVGVRAENMHVVTVELTLADLVPRLAQLRPLAAESCAKARARLREVAEELGTSTSVR